MSALWSPDTRRTAGEVMVIFGAAETPVMPEVLT
jgi:hypothetical protein